MKSSEESVETRDKHGTQIPECNAAVLHTYSELDSDWLQLRFRWLESYDEQNYTEGRISNFNTDLIC